MINLGKLESNFAFVQKKESCDFSLQNALDCILENLVFKILWGSMSPVMAVAFCPLLLQVGHPSRKRLDPPLAISLIKVQREVTYIFCKEMYVPLGTKGVPLEIQTFHTCSYFCFFCWANNHIWLSIITIYITCKNEQNPIQIC